MILAYFAKPSSASTKSTRRSFGPKVDSVDGKSWLMSASVLSLWQTRIYLLQSAVFGMEKAACESQTRIRTASGYHKHSLSCVYRSARNCFARVPERVPVLKEATGVNHPASVSVASSYSIAPPRREHRVNALLRSS